MPLTNVLKKRLTKEESPQSGKSRWAALGMILSMTACTSSSAADIRLSGVSGMMHMGVDPVKALDAMKAAGFNSMRTDFFWKQLEKTKGVFAWPSSGGVAAARKAVSLQKSLGMKPIGIFNYGNSLYPGTGTSPEFIAGFTRYAKWLATELKGSVHHWEVWNEWNGGIGLPCKYGQPPCNDVKAYLKVLCPVYAVVKQVDPSIVLIGGVAVGDGDPFIYDMIKEGGAKCLDAVSMHPYRYGRWFEPAEVTLSRLETLQNRIKAITGTEFPFYVTEEGVPVYPGGKHTLDEQADHLARFYLAARAYSFIKGIAIFSLTDVNARSPRASSYGLMYRDFTPKPAYSAMQKVTGLFVEGEFLGKVKSPSDIWLLKFREPNGSYTYAVWSTGASTKLIFDAPVAGTLNIQKVGSDPIAITKTSFQAGSNAISVAVSSTPRIIRPSVAKMDIKEAAK